MPGYSSVGGGGVHNAAMFTVDSNGAPSPVSATSPVPTTSGAATAANVLNGFQTFTATTGATTLLTVPAGRTWVGKVGAGCSTTVAAAGLTAGQARAVIATAGAGVTPAAGTVFAVEANAAVNAATGTVGSSAQASQVMPLTVVAPGGNSVTLTVVTTQGGTSSRVDAWASGALVAV